MTPTHLALIAFVLEEAPKAPVNKRIAVYRGLADLCGDVAEAKSLEALADELERAERRCSEFAFQFTQKNLGTL